MTRKTPDAPKDGDYAKWLEQQGTRAPDASAPTMEQDSVAAAPAEAGPRKQTIEDVLVLGEEPTEEFLEEWRGADEFPVPSDDELERQALEAGAEDGNPETPV